MQVDTRVVTFVFLEGAGNDGSGKTWFIPLKGEGLRVRDLDCGLLRSRSRGRSGRFSATADHHHVRRHGHTDGRCKTVDAVSRNRKPQSGVEQIAGVWTNVGEL